MASFGAGMEHSKNEVNRAGRSFADAMSLVVRGHVAPPAPDVVEAFHVIEWWRKEHAKPLSRVAANLRYYAADEGAPVVAQRLKKLPTIADKLLREPAMKLSRMADIGGVRAVLPDQDAAYRVATRLRRNWTITRFRDYVAEPKADGYRALHLINRNRGRLIEVQLRTPGQDEWANVVEGLARSIAPGLKFGGGPAVLREYFIASGELSDRLDRELPISPALVRRVRSLLAEVDTFLDRAVE